MIIVIYYDNEETLQRETSKRQTVEIALLQNSLVRFAMMQVMVYYDDYSNFYDEVCPFTMMTLW